MAVSLAGRIGMVIYNINLTQVNERPGEKGNTGIT